MCNLSYDLNVIITCRTDRFSSSCHRNWSPASGAKKAVWCTGDKAERRHRHTQHDGKTHFHNLCFLSVTMFGCSFKPRYIQLQQQWAGFSTRSSLRTERGEKWPVNREHRGRSEETFYTGSYCKPWAQRGWKGLKATLSCWCWVSVGSSLWATCKKNKDPLRLKDQKKMRFSNTIFPSWYRSRYLNLHTCRYWLPIWYQHTNIFLFFTAVH